MLFYRKVRLAVTRHSLKQLIFSTGPDVALKIAKNPNVDLIYLDRDFGLRTEDTGGRSERHRPATVTVLDSVQQDEETVTVSQTLESLLVEMFREATGDSLAGERMALELHGQMAAHPFDGKLLELATGDWEDPRLVRQVLVDVVHEFAPRYSIPRSLRVSLTRYADEHYRFETNLDWAAVSRAGTPAARSLFTGPVPLLLGMVEMRQDLALGASLGASLAQDRLGARITRTKCKEFTALLDDQQGKADRFQNLVVKGIGDLRGVINSRHRSFGEFLDVLEEAEAFRSWLDQQVPTSDLVASYYAEVFKKSPMKKQLEKRPVKALRWLLPVVTDFSFVGAHATPLVGPAAAAGVAAFDKLVLDRFKKGWRPGMFINEKLMPFVNDLG